MQTLPLTVTCKISLAAGECMQLPPEVTGLLGEGEWLLMLRRLNPEEPDIWDPEAFLASYGPEDEGLYDDLVAPDG